MNKKYEMENLNEVNLNYYENLIKNLQYTNSLLNKRNISLEKELELIKNKYNFCKQDLDNINNHISICKNTQEKIIKDLQERNDYLEKLYDSKVNNNINEEREDLNYKNFQDKVHLFVERMKILFNYNVEKDLNDEEYLDFLANSIIKMNEEVILTRNELNKKVHEINKLNNEIQNLKFNNNNFNNNDYRIPNDKIRVKTPKLKYLNNKNIQLYPTVEKSNSPKSLRNKEEDNNISMKETPKLNPEILNDNYNNNTTSLLRTKNKKINIDKKMINSHSFNSYKYKTLKESEKENLYKKTTLNNNKNLDSNEVIQNLMNNIKHLESTFNNRPNLEDNI